MYQKSKTIENVLVMIVDLVCLLTSVLLAFWMRFELLMGINRRGDQMWMVPLMIFISVALEVCFDFNHHFSRRGLLEDLAAIFRKQLAFSVVWVLCLYLIHRAETLPRLVFGYFAVTSVLLMFAGHLLLRQYLLKVFRKGRYSSRLLLVSTRERVESVIKNIVGYNEWMRIMTGIVLLDGDGGEQEIAGYPVVADPDSFIDYVTHHDIDEVFIIDSERRHIGLMEPWIQEMEEMGIIVDVNIDIFDINVHGKKTLNRVGKYAVVTFARNLFSVRQMIAKRCLDIVGSLVGMVLLALAAIFVAPAIKLESPGPVFFGQTRVGKNGRKFTFYKFRSMYQDAEQRKQELMKDNEVQGLMFKMKDDPRITRVGRFIRKTSIDELPQFWNILKGDMSLVGTRPPTIDEFERYEAKHKCRLSMTPGLTGLWQISGRSDITDFDEVVRLDMQYIDNWSILKDIKILFITVYVVLAGKGSR
ncbi:MAG: sugar transferase [Lachnospiraceae bacterium]|nr:sugar transferase [Lachnospiraceae bacterium]